MSKIKTSRNRKTCSVFGCMNSNLQNPEMAFFSLPSDPQRLTSWLSLMDREDLANKPERHYRVCETHFDRGCILLTSNRKVLKKNALPSLRLPATARLEKSVQTPRTLLPVVFRLKSGGVRDAAELLCADDISEDTSLYCEEGTAARGRGELLDVTGNTVGRIHEGFQCNMCNADIVGFRYTCVQCPDYDLCAACEAGRAHAGHYVLRVPGPRCYAETQAVLSRIRRQLLGAQAAGPDNAELSDSLKLDIKLEADDPLDPGPDPLQHAESTERQNKGDTSTQANIRTSLETLKPIHIEDTIRKANRSNKDIGKPAHIETQTDRDNTTTTGHLLIHELTNEPQQRPYLEQLNDDDLPLKRLYTDLSTHNMPGRSQFLELPTVMPQERPYIESGNDNLLQKRPYLESARSYTDLQTDNVPEKRKTLLDESEKRQYNEQSRYNVSEERQSDRTLPEATASQKTEDHGSFGIEVYTHTNTQTRVQSCKSVQKVSSKKKCRQQVAK